MFYFDPAIGFGEIALIGSVLIAASRKIPVKYRAFKRHNRLCHLRSIRRNRANVPYISEITSSAHVYFGFFILTSCLFLALVYGVPSVEALLTQSVFNALLLALPIFTFELLWLQAQESGKKLIAEHAKLLRYKRFQR